LECGDIAVVFAGATRTAEMTAPFWRQYLIEDPTLPEIDVFYSGYDRGCYPTWLDGRPDYVKYTAVRDRIANTVVDENFLRSLIGDRLVDFQIYPRDDAEAKRIRIDLGWPTLSTFTLPDGSVLYPHSIEGTITNIRNGIHMAL
jgi:hypothetical protein